MVKQATAILVHLLFATMTLASAPDQQQIPPTWGFSYDHLAPIPAVGEPCPITMGTVLKLLLEPTRTAATTTSTAAAIAAATATAAAVTERLHTDFSAMKQQYNGTAVRFFLPLDSVLTSPRTANKKALQELQVSLHGGRSTGGRSTGVAPREVADIYIYTFMLTCA